MATGTMPVIEQEELHGGGQRGKKCIFLTLAAGSLHTMGDEFNCWRETCALWNEHLGVCGLIAEGWLRGIEIARQEAGK